ncbi:hypothetical protein DI272_41910 [Streptomyces sp. Act143]|uniref:DUF7824 domain-containing protein n=1 Tax=Streptomyces sp. Act143 TaxID=2200760 RepID=UPI000D67C069|nr:DUF6493 family protein [Streptomyces sp. Act143]PWI19998.1 hypothetical protein DI272_41910 [Streptomyces sp. Act143]
MNALMDAVRAGRTSELPGLLDGMTDAERRAVFPEVRELRKELRADRWGGQARRAYPALQVAGAACQTGAAAVANWLAAADMRWWQAPPAVLIDVLADREPDWLADVVHRLAQRPPSARVPYELMAGLVRLSACQVPTTQAYVEGWMRHMGSVWQRGDTMLARLRKDPHLPELVAALFETDDVGGTLQWPAEDGPDSWTGALAQLTAEGALERGVTVHACVARLLRGGSTADHRGFLRLLKALDLTRDEERARTAEWLALAADAPSVVAAHAQSVLGRLALDGELSARLLAEMSSGVLFRTEKKLVRSQLVLLGKAVTRDAATADELLPAAAQAFGHEDSDVQERALKLVERHMKKAGTEARRELALAAQQLIPTLRTRAFVSLDAAPVVLEPVVYEEVLPPAPEPVRLAPAPESVAELAEEVGALLVSGGDVAAFERTLDGLVRHAHADREGLVEALGPVVARLWWATADVEQVRESTYFSNYPPLHLVLATLLGKVRTAALHAAVVQGTPGQTCVHSALDRAFRARISEVAYRVRTDPLPFLLSTPTWSTGLLEPDELVERLDGYRRLGARPSDADFAQALLRVRRGDRTAAASAAERAAALGTAEGTRLADWLASGGPQLPVGWRRTPHARILVEFDQIEELQDDFPREFRPLGRPVSVYRDRWHCYHWDDSIRPHWLALLPERRELVAARILRDLSTVAVEDTRGAAAVLPLLAESGGEAGDAVHLCVAYGLGARHEEDRLAAVDALLVLAARGQLDTELLGADLGTLVRGGAVKPLRLADALRTAASTGANATIWGLLRHTLPPLLDDLATGGPDGQAARSRGLGELLAVAAECAERSGARGELPHLAGAAARRGSSRLVTQARRLHGALTEEAAA